MARFALLLVVAIATTMGLVQAGYVNEFDKAFTFECGANEVISHISSTHSDYYEDRRYAFKCRNMGSDKPIGDCSWSDWSAYDEDFVLRCPNQGAIAGIDSEHNNYYEDRRFKIKCCTLKYTHKKEMCSRTNALNTYDNPMSFNAPEKYYINTIITTYKNVFEDRKFELEICEGKPI